MMNDMTRIPGPMKGTELRTFTFAPTEGVEFSIRTFMRDGVPWFVTQDACRAAGIANHRYAAFPLAADEKGVVFSDTPGGRQHISCVAESGLYKIIMRSTKLEARKFQDWVTRIVLPTIRQTGSYVMGEERIAPGPEGDDELTLRVIESLQRKIAKRAEENAALAARVVTIEAVVEAQAPAVAMVEEHYGDGGPAWRAER